MNDYENLSVIMERILNKYDQFQKKKHCYCEGVDITHREIHTIAYIGDHPGINLTKLADVQGITKSAASQMISRMRKKQLVEKRVSENSEAEIIIELTEYGQIAYKEHAKYHAKANNKFIEYLKHFPESKVKEMEEVLLHFDHALDEWNNN